MRIGKVVANVWRSEHPLPCVSALPNAQDNGTNVITWFHMQCIEPTVRFRLMRRDHCAGAPSEIARCRARTRQSSCWASSIWRLVREAPLVIASFHAGFSVQTSKSLRGAGPAERCVPRCVLPVLAQSPSGPIALRAGVRAAQPPAHPASRLACIAFTSSLMSHRPVAAAGWQATSLRSSSSTGTRSTLIASCASCHAICERCWTHCYFCLSRLCHLCSCVCAPAQAAMGSEVARMAAPSGQHRSPSH